MIVPSIGIFFIFQWIIAATYRYLPVQAYTQSSVQDTEQYRHAACVIQLTRLVMNIIAIIMIHHVQ